MSQRIMAWLLLLDLFEERLILNSFVLSYGLNSQGSPMEGQGGEGGDAVLQEVNAIIEKLLAVRGTRQSTNMQVGR